MKIEILGCSGGMGPGEYTTCIRIDEHILIDAGSGLGKLSQHEMLAIKQVFLTHAHLDHICFLPLFLDNLFEQLSYPIKVHALPEVIEVLKKHVFNWSIWPDFTCLPNIENAVLEYHPILLGEAFSIGGDVLSPVLAQHVVPACGYCLKGSDGQTFCFSGDTYFDEVLVEAYNGLGPIDALMLECAFPNRLQAVAINSQHLTPNRLAEFIHALDVPPKNLWITHLKPAVRDEIWKELTQLDLPVTLRLLSSGDTFFL